MAGQWNSGKSFSFGWATPYLQEAEKWLPIYWPNYEYETRQPPFLPFTLPIPPNGYGGLPWWKNPDKATWPYSEIPWAPKVFGALSARKVIMRSKNPDPAGELKSHPPFGTMKVDTPTDRPHSIGTLRIQMRPEVWLDITPPPRLWAQGKLEEALRQMSRTRPIKLHTEDGSITIKSIVSAPWLQHDAEFKERKEALRATREERAAEVLAAEIVRTGGQSQPSKDLFT
jgi:hypothetical protein